ncbi:DNA helicase RecQ [Rhodocytophaga aerolata]|uniref:DNA helicase RecQ n=1 Tax=Rhodocytophaga aerolata TaxID=455078 RepID=A0ABT8R9C7_9BACT|nr:DNA helicase RecQ [Rhodocytophaga aerolata]MDO1448696.1 DNA helicase RecQ [Rhodocytophaga aerolata]
MLDTHTPEYILKQYFGYDKFRPMQAEIIEQVLSGKDTLVLMPTGGGKSICYQVPAMLMPGIGIVVSPLIALMKDQVESLLTNGVPAAYLNSSQSTEEQIYIEDQCIKGNIKLLYISPEKLLSNGSKQFLKKLPINLFAIDEAHCISGWGHDFRTEYTQLHILKSDFPQVPLIALTATADKLIRQDILDQLRLPNASVFSSSFDRKNLSLTVRPGREKFTQLMDFLDAHAGEAGIVYCLSRNGCEELAEKLQRSGYKAGYYHAGMATKERSFVQEAFLKDDIQIICATIAFGMGIDKSNVRWVVHYNLPKNMESYYQEIGRAGRDGLPADTILFYSFRDIIAWREILTKTTDDEKRLELQLVRLERMQQYAEALLCRRKILLNYFSEHLSEDCHNCDICKNPRTRFDGTILAQKALSAVIRLNESVNMGTLIDVLRGSRNAEIMEKGYHTVKTYGAGADLKTNEWREYLQQMVNTGILEVAYQQKYALHKGVLSQKILNGSLQVLLVKAETYPITQTKPAEPKKSKAALLQDQLLERLKRVRKQIADAQNVPPYIVFNDNSLAEMANKRPGNKEQFAQISGVGAKKMELYGYAFLKEIKEFVLTQTQEGTKIKGSTYLLTYEMYQQGHTLEEIASLRNLNIVTIQSHIATLWEQEYDLDIFEFINPHEIKIIEQAIDKVGDSTKAKEVFELLQGKYDYFKIKLAGANFRRQRKNQLR